MYYRQVKRRQLPIPIPQQERWRVKGAYTSLKKPSLYRFLTTVVVELGWRWYFQLKAWIIAFEISHWRFSEWTKYSCNLKDARMYPLNAKRERVSICISRMCIIIYYVYVYVYVTPVARYSVFSIIYILYSIFFSGKYPLGLLNVYIPHHGS